MDYAIRTGRAERDTGRSTPMGASFQGFFLSKWASAPWNPAHWSACSGTIDKGVEFAEQFIVLVWFHDVVACT